MEMTTLLRANIRHKKGSFISVLILAFLIVTTAAAVIGVKKNVASALERAQKESGMGNMNAIIADKLLTDELLQKVKDSALTEKVDVIDAVASYGKAIYLRTGNSTGNTYFFSPLREGLRLYDPDADSFEDTIPEPEPGEIYLPLGNMSKHDCAIGDTVRVEFFDKTRDYKIKGFLQEPCYGSMMIGWKNVFISGEEFDKLSRELRAANTERVVNTYKIVRASKADKNLSDAKFQRELNLETGIISKAVGSLSMEQSETYTTLFMEIILDVVLGFVCVLFVIVLVIMIHSIRTEIDIDYENLGILKAQGFTDSKLTGIILLRYVIAELLGMAAGLIASVPLERVISGIFKNITAVLPDKRVALIGTLAVILAMLAVSVLAVFISCRRLARISPVRAISGGRKDIYFQSRLNAPISGRFLGASVAYRSFSSSFTKYLGIIFITAVLTFFTVTVNIMGAAINSRSALSSMGVVLPDISLYFRNDKAYDHISDYESIVEKYTPISKKIYGTMQYYSLNGENIMCEIYEYPEVINGLLKGKLPMFDNEILVSRSAADALDLKIGDKVTVEGRSLKAEYIVSGFYQTMNDAGYAMSMSLEGAKRLGATRSASHDMVVADTSKVRAAVDELNERYGDIVTAEAVDFQEEMYNDTVMLGADAMKITIYAFSGIFALVAVIIVCSNAFTRERTDLGVLKALGFTSRRLRAQFALRFFIISVIGGAVGAAAGSLFSVSLLDLVFSTFGITKVYPDSTPLTYITAAAFVIICVTVFAYIVSGKIRKVEIRELVTE